MIISNANIITWTKQNQILNNYAIYINDGKIVDIGPDKEIKRQYQDTECINAHEQYVMPGNICAHTHFYGAFSTGLAIPGAQPKDFPEILSKLWWTLDKSLKLEDIRYSALICLIDAIKHGTTTLFDHHASPNAISGSLDEIAQTIEKSGVRASLCYEVTDRDGNEKAQKGIEENKRFIEYVSREKPAGGRIAACFGLHSSLTLSDETLEISRNSVSDDTAFHIHGGEHPGDEFDSIAKSGLRVVDRLQKHGILNPKTILAHGVHLDACEIAILAETGTWLSHQPRSNMNNSVGVPPVESMLRMGVKVCIGNDGFSHNMWEEWKSAYLIHKILNHDPRRVGGYDVIEMAIYNNSDLAKAHFEKNIGVISKGAEADLIFVDYHPYTPMTVENLPWHILFGFRDSMITSTMVAGKMLMKDREFITLDTEKIYDEALRIAPKVWERYQNNSK